MNIKKAIETKNHEKVLEISEKLLLEKNPEDLEIFLMHSRLVALIQLDKFDLARSYYKTVEPKLKSIPECTLISNYLLYKSESYETVASNLRSLKYETLSIGGKMLLAQAETKIENYLAGFKLFWQSYVEKSIPSHFMEDCLVNSINCLVLLLLSEDLSKLFTENSSNLRLVTDLISFLVTANFFDFTSRETHINTLLLFIVIEKIKPDAIYQFYLRTKFNFQQRSNELLGLIEKLLNAENKDTSQSFNPENFLLNLQGDSLNDHLTLFSLRTFVMQKNQEITWKKNEINTIEKLLLEEKGRISDEHLRISLVSFLAFIYSISETKNQSQINKILAKIDEELRGISKQSKKSGFLYRNLLVNKVILLLNNDNLTEAKKVTKMDLKLNEKIIQFSLLPVETQIIIKSKNQKDLESKVHCFDAQKLNNDPQYACVCFLFQLAVYYNWNNQKRYSEVFLDFVNNVFLQQLELKPAERFLTPEVFTQFTKQIVFYMIRNNVLMKSMKDKITNFIDYIPDSTIVLKMANLFIERKDFAVAEKILVSLAQKNPENTRIKSRLNYIYSVTNPRNIEENVLPQFEMIRDLNSIRNLENDFLAIIRAKNSGKSEILLGKLEEEKIGKDKNLKKKIQKKNRIKWPKNFDFNRPGQRPDPERWLPKHERKRFLKKAIKDGKLTKTQGVTMTSEQNKELFRLENSTANKNVVKNKQKKR